MFYDWDYDGIVHNCVVNNDTTWLLEYLQNYLSSNKHIGVYTTLEDAAAIYKHDVLRSPKTVFVVEIQSTHYIPFKDSMCGAIRNIVGQPRFVKVT